MLSHVGLLTTPWTVTQQAPLSIEFYRQKYFSVLPFPTPGGLPDPGIEPTSPMSAGRFFTTEPRGKPIHYIGLVKKFVCEAVIEKLE